MYNNKYTRVQAGSDFSETMQTTQKHSVQTQPRLDKFMQIYDEIKR